MSLTPHPAAPDHETRPLTSRGTRGSQLCSGQARAACAAALIATLALSACGTDDDEPEQPAQTSHEHEEEPQWHEEADTSTYTDELSNEDEDAAMQRAEEFVTAAAHHDDETEWWDRVQPFLTDTGIPNFNTVNPQTIEYTEVDGDPELYEAQTANLVQVDVSTDGPTMRVHLTRGGSEVWMVERWEYADDPTAPLEEEDSEDD